GERLQTRIGIDPIHEEAILPAGTLQVIIENALHRNSMSKSRPLVISIDTTPEGTLVLRHNINPRTIVDGADRETRLDELILKYELLHQPTISVVEEAGSRVINIPFINSTADVWE